MKKLFLLVFLTLFLAHIFIIPHTGETSTSDEQFIVSNRRILESFSQEANSFDDAVKQIPTYFLSSWHAADWGQIRALCDYLGVSKNYEGFKQVVETYFIPMAIRGPFHLRYSDITSYSQEVEDFLKVCDDLGLLVSIYLTDWGYAWAYPEELRGKNNPEAMSYSKDGTAQPEYVIPLDFLDIVYPYYEDKLKKMLDIYGYHKCLVGIGTETYTDGRIYGYWERLADYGFNLLTIGRFVTTDYYRVDVDSSGFHADRTKCKLWQHYVEKTVTYTIAELASDIVTYHFKRTDRPPPIKGWTAYLNRQNIELVLKLHDFVQSYKPDRTWILQEPFSENIPFVALETRLYEKTCMAVCWYAGELPHPLHDVNPFPLYRSLDDTGNLATITWVTPLENGFYATDGKRITESEMLDIYLVGYPTHARHQIVHEHQWTARYITLTDYVTNIMRNFGSILNRMRYYGGWFGEEKGAVKALVIGEWETGYTPQFLTPAFDVTLTKGEFEDMELTRFGDFTGFNVIVVTMASRPRWEWLTEDCRGRILNFAYNGRGLIFYGDLPSDVAAVAGTGTPVGINHPIMRPFTDIAGAPTVKEYTYGAGKIFSIKGLTNNRNSDCWVITTNTILYAAGKTNLIPAWWYGTVYTQTRPWSPNLHYSICGKPETPKLLWLSNRETSPQTFEIHLSSSFFNIDPNGWIAIDVQSQEVVAKGSGNDIKINTTIPALSWKPIYIMNATSNLPSPPTTHTLSVTSSPITGVSFTLDGIGYTTPYSTNLNEGTHTVVMASTITSGGTTYNFVEWEDGTTNPVRTINLTTDMTLTAYYQAYSPPPPPPPPPLPLPSYSPTNEALNLTNPSIGKQGTLAMKQPYIFQVNVTDSEGVTSLNYVDLILDPSGHAIKVRWTENNNAWTEINDPNDYIYLGSCSKRISGNQITLNFAILFRWAYPDENLHSVQVYSLNDEGLSDDDGYTNIYYVENDLVIQTPTISDTRANPNQTITISGNVYYEGTSIPPPDGDYQVKVKLSGIQKGPTNTTLTSGHYTIIIPAESIVGSYTYQVSCSHNVSSVDAPLVIVDKLMVSINADAHEVYTGTRVNLTITITRQHDSSTVTSFLITITRNGITWLTLTDQTFNDTLLIPGHYTYSTESITDNTYGLTTFETNNLTIKWRQKIVKIATVNIAIQAKDRAANTPISGASVYIKNETWTSETKYTNASGWANFINVEVGTYTIVGEAKGYATALDTVSFTTDITYTLLVSKRALQLAAMPIMSPDFALILIAASAFSALGYCMFQRRSKR